MKIDHTLKVHEKHSGLDSDSVQSLKAITDQMPSEAKEIFEESIVSLCTGEMHLYARLIQAGLDPLTAARAAVEYPDPMKFHQSIEAISSRDAKDAYETAIAQGTDPLLALVLAAKETRPYRVEDKLYQERLATFAVFVAAQVDSSD